MKPYWAFMIRPWSGANLAIVAEDLDWKGQYASVADQPECDAQGHKYHPKKGLPNPGLPFCWGPELVPLSPAQKFFRPTNVLKMKITKRYEKLCDGNKKSARPFVFSTP
eukprot:6460422-Amphidinium_carterae.1